MSEQSDGSIPPKPEAVTEYERVADKGAWYDEGGCTLAIVPALGVLAASQGDYPIGYAGLALAPPALWLWGLAIRRWRRMLPLLNQARDYVRLLTDAEEQGAVIPELSPPLKSMYETEKSSRRHLARKAARKRR
ncbi:hypothetical protein [Streptomyces sp. I05A-00742]|uniref:hypothetical protein n=1 Tax=Streptomyces sp. I05A-00742 TaxID=2732853 RepID=UPI001489BC13|nr:hypothetical protein [Streptomyces sp. I05A-00742]